MLKITKKMLGIFVITVAMFAFMTLEAKASEQRYEEFIIEEGDQPLEMEQNKDYVLSYLVREEGWSFAEIKYRVEDQWKTFQKDNKEITIEEFNQEEKEKISIKISCKTKIEEIKVTIENTITGERKEISSIVKVGEVAIVSLGNNYLSAWNFFRDALGSESTGNMDTRSQSTESEDTESEDTESEDAESEDTESEDTESEDTESKDTVSGSTGSKGTGSQSTGSESTGSENAGNEDLNLPQNLEIVLKKENLIPTENGGFSISIPELPEGTQVKYIVNGTPVEDSFILTDGVYVVEAEIVLSEEQKDKYVINNNTPGAIYEVKTEDPTIRYEVYLKQQILDGDIHVTVCTRYLDDSFSISGIQFKLDYGELQLKEYIVNKKELDFGTNNKNGFYGTTNSCLFDNAEVVTYVFYNEGKENVAVNVKDIQVMQSVWDTTKYTTNNVGTVINPTLEEYTITTATVNSMITSAEKKATSATVYTETSAEKKATSTTVYAETSAEKKATSSTVYTETSEEEKATSSTVYTETSEEEKATSSTVYTETSEEEKATSSTVYTETSEEEKATSSTVYTETSEEEKATSSTVYTETSTKEETKSITSYTHESIKQEENATQPINIQ